MKNAFVAAALCALAAPASFGGIVYNFACITNSNAGNAASGSTQLAVDVSPGPGANQVSFLFTNSGPLAMSITDTYFDDGTLLGIASISSSAGVSFSQGASPPDLPGGNSMSPIFNVTAGFSADSNPPAQPNGVNPGESLTITFNLLAGVTYADTITALNTPGDHLRIGIHVQGYGNGGSESFVNNTPAPGVAGLGLIAGALSSRRRRR